MSFLTAVDNTVLIRDLDALRRALRKAENVELVKQNTYRSHESSYSGRSAAPKGWDPNEMNKNAAYAIRATDKNDAYEVGLIPVSQKMVDGELTYVPDPTAKEYMMMVDYYNSGNGLLNRKGMGDRKTIKVNGKDTVSILGELKQNYNIEALRSMYEAQGQVLETRTTADGRIIGEVHVQA